jgi:CubicO group peptidase (beta-lactamase class C family)
LCPSSVFTLALELCYKPHRSKNVFRKRLLLNRTAQGFSPPLPAFEHQDDIFSSAFSILTNAIQTRAFPGASLAVTHQGRLVALKAAGQLIYESDAGAPPFSCARGGGGDLPVQPATLFDLASLTKVVATTTMSMLVYERGLLDLDAPVAAIVPEFISASPETKQDPRRHEVTLRMLLAHCSGLPAYERLFVKARTRAELLHAALAMSLSTDPGRRAEYSDIGFIILGVALERLTNESLDRFCQREVFGPLGMTSTTYNPPPEQRKNIPPTVNECAANTPVREKPNCGVSTGVKQNPALSQSSTFRGRIIQGEVHDENASVLGGIAGHAGLFATAEDVARFAHCILDSGRPILRPETVARFTRRESSPEGTSRALGWDTPSPPSQSGKYFTSHSFGHLGYTGTSLWIDPERQLSITLLTNRTWPDCANNAIKQLRPDLHDAVLEALEKSA